MNDLPRNISRCCRTSFVSQVTDVASIINTSPTAPWSELHLFGNALTFSQSSWNQFLRKWANPYINPSVFFFFLFTLNYCQPPGEIYLRITFSYILWALLWCCWLGMHSGFWVIYLLIKLLLKDEDSLIDDVLFVSMSLGIRHCTFITDRKSHLQWQSTEISLLQSLLYVHRIQIRMNPECKSSYLTEAVTTHVKMDHIWQEVKVSHSNGNRKTYLKLKSSQHPPPSS